MPIYEYKCEKCGGRFEVRQHFDDAPIAKCQNDACQGGVHRVLSVPAIIFKGSGFHINDYGRGNHRKPEADTSAEKSETSSEAAKTATD